ncbi:MAG TPA: hypothetical protein VL201_05250, partial [Patescibacteria group bacterium]|nr:hypothetical protein [Patescibacteria group bacterium]
ALCKKQREIHKSSSLVPYFDLISSNILLKKDAQVEALEVIKNATYAVGNTEIAPLIKLKHALMLLDSNDALTIEEGLKELTALTQDTHSRIHDMALYQLGRYFFAINENEKAKDTWKLLIEQSNMHSVSSSPWATLAQQKINQLL